MSFTICNCGHTINDHNFRHPFKDDVKVQVKYKKGKQVYIVDALDYPENVGIKCSYNQCSLLESLHQSLVDALAEEKMHPFTPVQYKYRNINLVLPKNALCHTCTDNVTLEQHIKLTEIDTNTQNSHHFSTIVVVENKDTNDKVFLSDPFMEYVTIKNLKEN